MPEIRLEHVVKSYAHARVVDDVSLTIGEGEFVTLLGPSGCGKTTTLRMVAGFVTPDTGEIYIAGKKATRVPVNKRNTAMVFQNFALFPNMTVAQNIDFGLKVRGIGGTQAAERVREALRLVHLQDFADRLPRQMSGGQQQRVALARAVVIRPDILLLDEPMSALDLKLRQDLQVQIRQIQQTLGVSALYVTHDQGEALRMSDRVAVMNKGKIVQVATPQELYRQPADAFVANFLGKTNLIQVRILSIDAAGETCTVATSGDASRTFRVSIAPTTGQPPEPGTSSWLGFRPEVAVVGEAHDNRMVGELSGSSYSGAIWNLTLDCGSDRIEFEMPFFHQPPRAGERLAVSWRAQDCFLLPLQD